MCLQLCFIFTSVLYGRWVQVAAASLSQINKRQNIAMFEVSVFYQLDTHGRRSNNTRETKKKNLSSLECTAGLTCTIARDHPLRAEVRRGPGYRSGVRYPGPLCENPI